MSERPPMPEPTHVVLSKEDYDFLIARAKRSYDQDAVDPILTKLEQVSTENAILREGAREVAEEYAALRQKFFALQRQHDERCKWLRHWQDQARCARGSSYVSNAQRDTNLLDGLQERMTGYGEGWVCRLSDYGRGVRLHETSRDGGVRDVREAIALFLQKRLGN